MIPHQGRGVETPNFRNVKESESVDMSTARVKGVPLDSGLATPAGEMADPFEEFNSVTLHHDGDDHSHNHGNGDEQGSGGGDGHLRMGGDGGVGQKVAAVG